MPHDKKLLEKFATTVRRELMRKTSEQLLSPTLREDPLIKNRLREISVDGVIDEVSYTWFNRLITLRYLELHNYLPAAISMQDFWHSLPSLNKAAQFLDQIFPTVFGPRLAYTYRLIPANLFAPNQAIELLLKIPVTEFTDTAILGWLYQYYNSVAKKRAIQSKKPYQLTDIPYATQIFTPEFISQFLVQNSLGKLWLSHGGDQNLAKTWPYYFSSPTEESIGATSANLDPRAITFFDPCCGSGHILLAAFELFMQFYLSCGFEESAIPALILQYNIYGLEIDERATQIATIVILLKAREYDPDIFTKDIISQLNIMTVPDSNEMGKNIIATFRNRKVAAQANILFDEFVDGKNLGSLILPEELKDLSALKNAVIEEFPNEQNLSRQQLMSLIKAHQLLSSKYNVVVTNPPYIASGRMNEILKSYVSTNFPDAKQDLYTAFIERCAYFTNTIIQLSYFGLMTPQNWLFTQHFSSFRTKFLSNNCIKSLIQSYNKSFFNEAAVNICAFIAESRSHGPGLFMRLNQPGDLKIQAQTLRKNLTSRQNIYQCMSQVFLQNRDAQILYWLDQQSLQHLRSTPTLSEFAETKQGIITGDNAQFLRFWYEINPKKLGKKWHYYNKGGGNCKWYGNREYVIDWQDDGGFIKRNKSSGKRHSRPQNLNYNFCPALSWSIISDQNFAVRYYDEKFTFGSAGPCCFPAPQDYLYLLGLLNSSVGKHFASTINPTLNLNVGDVAKIPIIFDSSIRSEVELLTQQNLQLAKQDYDTQEISQDFVEHPLTKYPNSNSLADSYELWRQEMRQNFAQLKSNEEKINNLFIQTYQLNNALSAEVSPNQITLHRADQVREIKTFLSYLIGCYFGRYIIGSSGAKSPTVFNPRANYQALSLSFRQNAASPRRAKLSQPDINFLPLLPAYESSIASHLENFLTQIFGGANHPQNLAFIADTLHQEFGETATQTISRYLCTEFYHDHLLTYHHKPIYWLLDSGLLHSFRGLIYYHRLNTDLLSFIRQKYLLPVRRQYQKNLAATTELLQQAKLVSDQKWHQQTLTRQQKHLQELIDFDHKLQTIIRQNPKINFDDGIAANHAKLSTIFAKLK